MGFWTLRKCLTATNSRFHLIFLHRFRQPRYSLSLSLDLISFYSWPKAGNSFLQLNLRVLELHLGLVVVSSMAPIMPQGMQCSPVEEWVAEEQWTWWISKMGWENQWFWDEREWGRRKWVAILLQTGNDEDLCSCFVHFSLPVPVLFVGNCQLVIFYFLFFTYSWCGNPNSFMRLTCAKFPAWRSTVNLI